MVNLRKQRNNFRSQKARQPIIRTEITKAGFTRAIFPCHVRFTPFTQARKEDLSRKNCRQHMGLYHRCIMGDFM